MLHAAETWAMTVASLNRLRHNDRAMIRWICKVKAKDEVSSDSLLSKLGIQDLDVVLHTSRMRWFGHVERSTGWIAKVRKLNVVAQKRPGRPRKRGMKCWWTTERSWEWTLLIPRTILSGEDVSEKDLSNKATLGRGKPALKRIWWSWWWCKQQKHILTLVLLNPDAPCLCKQCRSRSVAFWRSQLIWICTVCLSMWIYINNLD